MRDFEYSGIWWLPEDDENDVAGILKFSERDGIRLELIGSFSELSETVSAGKLQHKEPIILGLIDRNLVTLQSSLLIPKGFSAPGFKRDEYRPRFALIGAHFQSSEEVCIHKADVFYTYLEDWVPQVAGANLRIIKDHGNRYQYEVSYTKPEQLIADITNGRIIIEADVHQPWPSRRITLHEYVKIQIQLTQCLQLDAWLNDYVTPLQNLLTLATDHPNAVSALFVYVKDNSDDDDEVPIEVFYHPTYDASISDRKNISEHELLFSLRDRADEFPLIVQKWLTMSKELAHVVRLYFNGKYQSSYSQHNFDDIIRCIEAYHRERHPTSTARDPETLARCVEALLSQVPDTVSKNDQDWAKSKLLYNDPPLDQRLRELVTAAQSVMNSLVPDTEKFIERVTKARHKLTHASANARPDIQTLFEDTEILIFLMKALFLLELGLPCDLVAHLPSYRYTKSSSS